MPKNSTLMPRIEDSLQIKVSTLKQWGKLKCSGATDWSFYQWINKDGFLVASVSYSVETLTPTEKQLHLKYISGGKEIDCCIEMVPLPCNIGGGVRWYFICPKTGKRCTAIVSPPNSDNFYHRSAFGLLYDMQTWSKKDRAWGKLFFDFQLQKMQKRIGKRRTYAGKPTKLRRKIAERQRLSKIQN